jgi:hypothetical protein
MLVIAADIGVGCGAPVFIAACCTRPGTRPRCPGWSPSARTVDGVGEESADALLDAVAVAAPRMIVVRATLDSTSDHLTALVSQTSLKSADAIVDS